mmetsp:Transcript_3417/g.8155  ORF Transcript_3417/g.8155 Transcript_3417/m.8155 type:complete len:206 (-) Transcript_3417:1187-1804(-)
MPPSSSHWIPSARFSSAASVSWLWSSARACSSSLAFASAPATCLAALSRATSAVLRRDDSFFTSLSRVSARLNSSWRSRESSSWRVCHSPTSADPSSRAFLAVFSESRSCCTTVSRSLVALTRFRSSVFRCTSAAENTCWVEARLAVALSRSEETASRIVRWRVADSSRASTRPAREARWTLEEARECSSATHRASSFSRRVAAS